MINLDEKKLYLKEDWDQEKLLGVRIEKGKVYKNNEIKNYLAKEYKHFNNQILI